MTYFDKNLLRDRLNALPDEQAPLWGILTPQHMVEHLALSIQFSNGKRPMQLAIPEDKVAKAKARLLDPEWQIPVGFKAAFMPAEGLPPLQYPSKAAAVEVLLGQMDDFFDFYTRNPEAAPIHPYFGALNQSEWQLLHHKHFGHHLRQFGVAD